MLLKIKQLRTRQIIFFKKIKKENKFCKQLAEIVKLKTIKIISALKQLKITK